MRGFDHGMLSGIRRRSTPAQRRKEAASIERTIDHAMTEVKAQQEAEAAEARARYAERNKPVPYTPEQLQAARAIRTMYGWQRVIRVNAKSVTVVGDFGDYRVPISTILEVKP